MKTQIYNASNTFPQTNYSLVHEHRHFESLCFIPKAARSLPL